MAHFARLENNKVVEVIVINNDVILENGIESEEKGIAFCQSLFGEESIWKQTSYNGTIRKNFAGLNYTYDAIRDAFISPKPLESWVIDEATCRWTAPIAMPSDENVYCWSEIMGNWIPKPDSGFWNWNNEKEIWEESLVD